MSKGKRMERRCFSFTPIASERQARRAIDQESFERPVMVDFFSHGCSYCADTVPELDDLAGHVCDDAKIIKVDVDASRKLAEEHNVSGLPTIAIFRNGRIVKRAEGYQPALAFLKMLEGSGSG